MSTVILALPPNLLMRAWTSFTQTSDFLNILSRATILEDTESSLFVAFVRGFEACESARMNHGNTPRG